jgi:hypothetical protein
MPETEGEVDPEVPSVLRVCRRRRDARLVNMVREGLPYRTLSRRWGNAARGMLFTIRLVPTAPRPFEYRI